MNNVTRIVIGMLAVVLIAGGAYVALGGKKGVPDESNTESAKQMADDAAMMKDENKSTAEKDGEMMSVGSFEAYEPQHLARAETGDVVLFFHASWCPSCRGLSADIEKNRNAIPSGVSILKVDYDTESQLKKKYGVTYQHTLVQVDKDGTLIKKWSGSPTLGSLVQEIE